MSSRSLLKCTGTIIVLLWSTMCQLSASLPSRNEPRDRSIQRRIDTASVACGSQERFHRPTGKCYQLNSQGPCGENMVFNQYPMERQQGICECVDHIGCEYWPFSPSAPSQNKCYPLYEQGPCPAGEWLIPHEDRHNRKSSKSSRRPVHGICKPRTCPPSSEPQTKMFSHRGTCYMTATQGFCSTPNEHMFFIKGSSEPKCFVIPAKSTMTKVCPAAAFGGGTYQEITVITPRPMAPPVLPPTDQSEALRIIGPTKALQNSNPDDTNSPSSTTFGPPRALSKSGVAGCSGGQIRSSDGICTSLALF